MLTKRIIPCLDIKDGSVVKGKRFRRLRVIGEPAGIARKYYEDGADEICILDINATHEGRKNRADLVSKLSKEIFIESKMPLKCVIILPVNCSMTLRR